MDLRWRAGVVDRLDAAGPHAFACGRTAATLLHYDGFGNGEVGFRTVPEVAVPHGTFASRGVRRLRNVAPADLTIVAGLRCTAPGRTIADLAAAEAADVVEWAVESALREGRIGDAELRRLAELPNRRGATVFREVLRRRPVGAPATESLLETRMVQLCRGSVPEPVRQLPVAPGANYRLDLAWPRWLVAVECDGQANHGLDRFDADRRRDNRLRNAGWHVLHFTWADVVGAPAATLRSLAVQLRRAGCPDLAHLAA